MNGNILKISLKKHDITQQKAADTLGVSRQTLNAWCKSIYLSDEAIENVKTKLRIDLHSEIDEIDARAMTSTDAVVGPLKEEYRLVPLLNLDAVGGMQAMNDESDIAQYNLGYIPFPKAQFGDICMRVSGSSMSPTYPSGSIVLLRKVRNWQNYFGYGHVFVLELEDDRRILKEINRCDEDPKNYVMCMSHNKEYRQEELPKKMIRSVYKVVMALTNEGF